MPPIARRSSRSTWPRRSEKELAKFDEPLRTELRAAYQTPADQRNDQQKQLLEKYPSANLTEGVLYQYNQAAADDLKKFDERIAAVRTKKPPEEFLQALVEPPNHQPETKLFYRGDYRQPKETISPGTLSVCSPESGRVEFAVKSTDAADHRSPAGVRKMAHGTRESADGARHCESSVDASFWSRNRRDSGRLRAPGNIAQPSGTARLVGRGAARAMGWSLKRLHRTIMLSTAYRQTSNLDDARLVADPDGRFYSRKKADAARCRRRSAIGRSRRAASLIARCLDRPWESLKMTAASRRGSGGAASQSLPVPASHAADGVDAGVRCPGDGHQLRSPAVSTVATQSLMLLNGEFWLGQAAALADSRTARANRGIRR